MVSHTSATMSANGPSEMLIEIPLTLRTPYAIAIASVTVLLLSLILLLVREFGKRGKSAETINGLGAVGVSAPEVEPKKKCYLLYGTQTGTAERFSKSLRTQLKVRYGDDTEFEVLDIEEYDAESRLAEETLVFFLLATYGDGEPTDNATMFFNWLAKAAQNDEENGELLKGVHYGVFGLGNKQYEHFCAVGNKVDKYLKQLGATQLVRRGDGDDDDDIDADFESWCSDLFEALDNSSVVHKHEGVTKVVTADDIASYTVDILPPGTPEIHVSHANGTGLDHNSCYDAKVHLVKELHSHESDRSCIHAEIDVSGSKIEYQSGDHFALYPFNAPDVVAEAARLLNADLNSVIRLSIPPGKTSELAVPFPGPVTLRTALAQYTDLLSAVSRQQLDMLAAFAGDAQEKKRLLLLASADGKGEFHDWVTGQQRSLLQIMAAFPSVKVPLGAFFGSIAPRMQPRLYSISSSPLMHPSTVHVTCAVVKEETGSGRVHEGVCSSWLATRRAGDNVTVYARRSHFKLPADPSIPLVMVGPGTGLAPFRGFLQERAALAQQGVSLGPAVLYFGCRNRTHDYIYQEELMQYVASGVLTKLHVAFSREGASKDYVQHHMLRHAQELWDMLGEGGNGVFYVCGDAKRMARDVHNTLIQVVLQCGKRSGTQAEAYVKQLSDTNRYQKDVW